MSANLEPEKRVVFDPTSEVIDFSRNRILLSTSREGIKQEQNKNCGFSPLHYLGKVWQHIWRPCTKMKKVWNKMQADGIKRISDAERLEDKLRMYKNLCENLTNFETQVINKHNSRRFKLFRKIHLAGVRIKPAAKTPLNELGNELFASQIALIRDAVEEKQFDPINSIKSGDLTTIKHDAVALRLYAETLNESDSNKAAILLIADAKELGINQFSGKPDERFICPVTYETVNANFVFVKIGDNCHYFSQDSGLQRSLDNARVAMSGNGVYQVPHKPNEPVTLENGHIVTDKVDEATKDDIKAVGDLANKGFVDLPDGARARFVNGELVGVQSPERAMDVINRINDYLSV